MQKLWLLTFRPRCYSFRPGPVNICAPVDWLSLHAPLDPLGLWVQNVSLAVAVSYWLCYQLAAGEGLGVYVFGYGFGYWNSSANHSSMAKIKMLSRRLEILANVFSPFFGLQIFEQIAFESYAPLMLYLFLTFVFLFPLLLLRFICWPSVRATNCGKLLFFFGIVFG